MATRNGTALLASLALILAAATSVASAETSLRYADASGNLIVQAAGGGAKIIRVGAAHKPSKTEGTATITAPMDKAVSYVVGRPNTGCESAVVLHGRSFMYGLDRGETPVLDHPGC